MKNDESRLSGPALASAFAGISDLFRSTTALARSNPDSPKRTEEYRKARGNASQEPTINELDKLFRDTAAEYQALEHEARSVLGQGVALPRLFPALRGIGVSSKGLMGQADSAAATMASLFRRVSAIHGPVVVPLVGRIEAGAIAVYEPYQRGFHDASVRTSIGAISGDWVRQRSDGNDNTPDIALDLEYAHGDPSPQVIVELTWVGREAVTASGGTNWASIPVIEDGETIAFTIASQSMTPVDGWVKLPLRLAAGSTTSVRYDVWMQTAADAKPAPDADDDPPIEISTTPLPLPVPSPTPTSIPNDFLAVLDPDRWRQIEDRLGQFVRETVGAFEGVLSRVDFLKDRTVLRDVSAALRERVRG